jgi:hypothetical protein
MIRKQNHWIFSNDEMSQIVAMLRTSKVFENFQQGVSINNFLLAVEQTEVQQQPQPPMAQEYTPSVQPMQQSQMQQQPLPPRPQPQRPRPIFPQPGVAPAEEKYEDETEDFTDEDF